MILLDRLTNLLHRDDQPDQPDDIEQWHAELRALPTAAELDKPATTRDPAVNGVNTGEAL